MRKNLSSNKIKKLTYKALFYDYYIEKCGVWNIRYDYVSNEAVIFLF